MRRAKRDARWGDGRAKKLRRTRWSGAGDEDEDEGKVGKKRGGERRERSVNLLLECVLECDEIGRLSLYSC